MWKQFPEKYTHNKSKAKKYQIVLRTYLVPSFMDHYCMNMKKQFILSLPQCVIYRLMSWKFMTKIYKSKIYQKPGSHVDRGVIVLPNFINHQQKKHVYNRETLKTRFIIILEKPIPFLKIITYKVENLYCALFETNCVKLINFALIINDRILKGRCTI